MPAYPGQSRDLHVVTHEALDRLAGHDRPQQLCETVASDLPDTLVEADGIFCVTHAWGLYPVSASSSASLKQLPAV